MALPNWNTGQTTAPPDPADRGYRRQRASMVRRTEMDSGPPRQRRFATGAPINWSLQWEMTDAQCDSAETFFDVTLEGGAKVFLMNLWINGAFVQKRVRFVEAMEFQYRAVNFWDVSARVEILDPIS